MRRLLLGILRFQLWSPNKEEALRAKSQDNIKEEKSLSVFKACAGNQFSLLWIQEFVSGVVKIRM